MVEPTVSNESLQSVTDEVLAAFGSDDRLGEVVRSLVRHLHEFARDVRLTETEWQLGIDFLTRAGHITDERRQEFILLSDVLGLSMMTVAINAAPDPTATEATVLGPFFAEGAPHIDLGGDISFGAPGLPCWVTGSVRATSGEPLAGVRIDVWEADEDGFYDVQRAGQITAGRGWLVSGPDGDFRFWSVKPSAYPLPADGPVGQLLDATGRHHWRPAHLHFMMRAAGYRTLITHLFVAGDHYLSSDAVFGVKPSLIVEVEDRPPGAAPDGRVMDGPWAALHYDFVLST